MGERRRRREAERAAELAASQAGGQPVTRRELRAREVATGTGSVVMDSVADRTAAPSPRPAVAQAGEPRPITEGLTRRELRELRERAAAEQAGPAGDQSRPPMAGAADPHASAAPPVTPHRGVTAATAALSGWPQPAPARRPVIPPPASTGPVTKPDSRTTALLPRAGVTHTGATGTRATTDTAVKAPSTAPTGTPAQTPAPDAPPSQVAAAKAADGTRATARSLPEPVDPHFRPSPTWPNWPPKDRQARPVTAFDPGPAPAADTPARPPAVAASHTLAQSELTGADVVEHHGDQPTPAWLTALMVIVLVVIMVVLGLLVWRMVQGSGTATTSATLAQAAWQVWIT